MIFPLIHKGPGHHQSHCFPTALTPLSYIHTYIEWSVGSLWSGFVNDLLIIIHPKNTHLPTYLPTYIHTLLDDPCLFSQPCNSSLRAHTSASAIHDNRPAAYIHTYIHLLNRSSCQHPHTYEHTYIHTYIPGQD